MSHTQEPWVWHAQGDADEYCLLTDDGKWVIAFRQNGELHTVTHESNARRIVACVNACAGFSTEVLEATVSEGKGVIRVLQRQRDGLLDAARNLRDDVKGRHHSEQAFKALVDTIAKVEAAEHGTNHGSKTA